MHSVSQSEPITHPSLKGVTIWPLGDRPEVGKPQAVRVCVEPHSEIPLHTHEVDAVMDVTRGSAILLTDGELNGTVVGVGSRVFFEAQGLHGFRTEAEPFEFVSSNGGIVGDEEWDISFAN